MHVGDNNNRQVWGLQRRKPELCTLEFESQTVDQTRGVNTYLTHEMDCKTRRRAGDYQFSFRLGPLPLLSVLYKTRHDTRGLSVPSRTTCRLL